MPTGFSVSSSVRGQKSGFEHPLRCAYPIGEGALQRRTPIAETYLSAARWADVMGGQLVQSTRARAEFEGKRNARGSAKSFRENRS